MKSARHGEMLEEAYLDNKRVTAGRAVLLRDATGEYKGYYGCPYERCEDFVKPVKRRDHGLATRIRAHFRHVPTSRQQREQILTENKQGCIDGIVTVLDEQTNLANIRKDVTLEVKQKKDGGWWPFEEVYPVDIFIIDKKGHQYAIQVETLEFGKTYESARLFYWRNNRLANLDHKKFIGFGRNSNEFSELPKRRIYQNSIFVIGSIYFRDADTKGEDKSLRVTEFHTLPLLYHTPTWYWDPKEKKLMGVNFTEPEDPPLYAEFGKELRYSVKSMRPEIIFSAESFTLVPGESFRIDYTVENGGMRVRIKEMSQASFTPSQRQIKMYAR